MEVIHSRCAGMDIANVNGHLGIRLRGQGFSGLVDRSYSAWVPVGW